MMRGNPVQFRLIMSEVQKIPQVTRHKARTIYGDKKLSNKAETAVKNLSAALGTVISGY